MFRDTNDRCNLPVGSGLFLAVFCLGAGAGHELHQLGFGDQVYISPQGREQRGAQKLRLTPGRDRGRAVRSVPWRTVTRSIPPASRAGFVDVGTYRDLVVDAYGRVVGWTSMVMETIFHPPQTKLVNTSFSESSIKTFN